jgi:tryptophan-rich sensory protein
MSVDEETQQVTTTTSSSSSVSEFMWTQFIPWVSAPLVLGFLPPALIFALEPGAPQRVGLGQVPIPAWVFIGVWAAIYPGMGLAGWSVWRRRRESGHDAWVPLAVLFGGLLITLSFWLTNSLRMTATIDAINLVMAGTTLWVVSRYSRHAGLFLLPWAVWMPITLTCKLAALVGLLR